MAKWQRLQMEEVSDHFADDQHSKVKNSMMEQLRHLLRTSRLYGYQSKYWLSRADYWPIAMLACVSLSILAAMAFLRWQSIWIDETTQLGGLTLGPIGLTHWLAGRPEPFLLQSDRMPPISYWADWGWMQLFGSGVQSLRTFGVVCVAGAVSISFCAARRASGIRA